MLSVSELNEQAKTLLETTFSYVEVQGEISRLTKHGSGHWYFTLKDENSSISAVIYKSNNVKLKFNVLDGIKVVLYGKISLYAPSGSYQFIATLIRPSGEGELELAFKQLQEKLSNEGLFDQNLKKKLPKFPSKIAIITSKTSAALQDMHRIINQKWPIGEIIIFDSLTQGENAAKTIINALKKADKIDADAIVIARGGGSREDLWCFNDENLAREIVAAKTPIISAIGHEIDYVISDFVADFRAPTPTAAMTTLLPDINEIMQTIDAMSTELDKLVKHNLERKFNTISLLKMRFHSVGLKQKIKNKEQILQNLKQVLNNAMLTKLLKLQNQIDIFKEGFKHQEQFFTQIKNFVRIQKDGKTVNLSQLQSGDEIVLSSTQTQKTAKIL
ncbi:MAG: exodeoxyribonuclease VII large subunit [Campylobacter sp.]